MEVNASGIVVSRFHRGAGGELISSPQFGWYVLDMRGSVVMRLTQAGTVLHIYRYTAFGIYLGTTSSGGVDSTNPFRFQGMYYDRHRGEYMTPNRQYNARLGRWTQPDPFFHVLNGNINDNPLNILQAGNLYMFVMHNPVRWHDPTGLFAVPIWTVSLKCPKKGTCKLTGQDGVGGAGGNVARLNRPAPSPAPVVPPKPGVTPPATVTAPKPGSIAAKNATAPVAPKTPVTANATTNAHINRVLSNATYTRTTSTGVQNFNTTGGIDAARAEFNSMNPTNVRTAPNGNVVGNLPGGVTVNLHPSSKGGGVTTLEFYNRVLQMQIKIRFYD